MRAEGLTTFLIKILNFKEDHIKVNKSALAEMNRLRQDCVFKWNHPLTEINGRKLCLLNIVSWDRHIQHFLSDKVYASNANIFCFTETHVNDY